MNIRTWFLLVELNNYTKLEIMKEKGHKLVVLKVSSLRACLVGERMKVRELKGLQIKSQTILI